MRHLLLLLLALLTAALPAQDDRDRTTPVESQWLTGQTPADLTVLQFTGWRFTDLEPTSLVPLLFSVSMVKNTGAWQKTWTFVTAASAVQLSAIVQQNMRIVDLEPYDTGSGVQFAAVLISNTGVDAKGWWWNYDRTPAQVDAAVVANNGRLTSFERYGFGTTKFAYVMIANTGADQRGWGYLYGASGATIDQTLATGMRIYGIDYAATDAWDVIFLDNPQGLVSWVIDGVHPNDAKVFVEQNLGRVVDVEFYAVGPVSFPQCIVSVLDAANPLEKTARFWFQNTPASSLGDYGFFLRQVNGPTLAAMRPDRPFEPAGTMTTLYHTHVMRRVALGLASLTTSIDKPFACGFSGSNQTVGNLLTQMMENGDAMATLAISNAFGITAIDATAGALGMTQTSVNYTLGCSGPSPQSTMTLRDLSTLHEQVANGYLQPGLVDLRPNFYSRMREDLSFPTWGTNDLGAWIDVYGQSIGLSAAALDVFKQKLHLVYVAGGASWPITVTNHYYYSEGGWMKVPFRAANGLLQPVEFTFGVFNHDYNALEPQGREAMCRAELELVWDRVKAALDTWTDYVPGSITPLLGGGSCPGSAGTPFQSSSSLPDLEETIFYGLENGPPNGVAVAMFGFSLSSWGGVPLPLDLAPIGAPGCLLRTEPSVMLAGILGAGGVMRTAVPVGTDPALIGAVWYSQYLVLDPPANAFGATLSNVLRTQIGGSD